MCRSSGGGRGLRIGVSRLPTHAGLFSAPTAVHCFTFSPRGGSSLLTARCPAPPPPPFMGTPPLIELDENVRPSRFSLARALASILSRAFRSPARRVFHAFSSPSRRTASSRARAAPFARISPPIQHPRVHLTSFPPSRPRASRGSPCTSGNAPRRSPATPPR